MRLLLILGVVFCLWSNVRSQNLSCSTASCGIVTCDPGYELNVALVGEDLSISCDTCAEGFAKSTTGPESCTACKDGLISNTNFTECELEQGYWRTSNDETAEVYECPNSAACIGGESICASGFTGYLCAVCEDSHYPSGYYECYECTASNSAHTIITIIIFAMLVGLFIFLMFKASEEVLENADGAAVDEMAEEGAQAKALGFRRGSTIGQQQTTLGDMLGKASDFLRDKGDTLRVKMKILVAHFQVVASFPLVLDVQWPDAFGRYADAFSIFNLDFWGILSKGCFFKPDFLKNLLFVTLLPIAIMAMLLGFFYFSRRIRGCSDASKRKAWNSVVSGVLLTGFFFYIITSTLILKAFDCQEFDDGETFLKADYSISCNSTRYKILIWYAGVNLIVFPIGVPVVFLMLLYNDRQSLNSDPTNPARAMEYRDTYPEVQKTRFLWATYRPNVFWYEVWETIRKLLLTGLLIYFREGTSTQVVIAMMITLLGLRVLAAWKPYKQTDENMLAEVALWVTFLTLLVGLLIKSEVTSSEGYDDVALGVLLSMMNVSLLLLGLLQILWKTSIWFKDKFSYLGKYLGTEGKTSVYGGEGGDQAVAPSSDRYMGVVLRSNNEEVQVPEPVPEPEFTKVVLRHISTNETPVELPKSNPPAVMPSPPPPPGPAPARPKSSKRHQSGARVVSLNHKSDKSDESDESQRHDHKEPPKSTSFPERGSASGGAVSSQIAPGSGTAVRSAKGDKNGEWSNRSTWRHSMPGRSPTHRSKYPESVDFPRREQKKFNSEPGGGMLGESSIEC